MRAMIRFGKQPRLRFISHLDLQRFFQRALNRTGLPIAFSQGFNPHPLLSFGSALALGWTSEYEIIDVKLAVPMGRKRTEEAMRAVSPEEGKVIVNSGWGTGCTDMGDLSAVMPACQPYACGAVGTGHGNDYRIADVNRACVNSAKAQVMMLSLLMKDDAAEARKVIDERRPVYSSIREYFETVDKITLDQDAVKTNEDGTITLTFANPE